MNALTQERLRAAAYLRELGSEFVTEPGVRLDQIACMIERHDERVAELVTYNNTALQEARDARAELRKVNERVRRLSEILAGNGTFHILTPEDLATIRQALAKNVEWHTELNDPDEGYAGSDLEEFNCEAQAVLNRHV